MVEQKIPRGRPCAQGEWGKAVAAGQLDARTLWFPRHMTTATAREGLSIKFKAILLAVLVTAAVAVPQLISPPPSNAAGWVTIFPNYGDWTCGAKGGSVQHVKVAGFPGRTTVNANNQRWARLDVAARGNVKIVAQVYCVYGFLRTPGGWNTVERTITNPVPWKSYYF